MVAAPTPGRTKANEPRSLNMENTSPNQYHVERRHGKGNRLRA
jgi:hypothetical protein